MHTYKLRSMEMNRRRCKRFYLKSLYTLSGQPLQSTRAQGIIQIAPKRMCCGHIAQERWVLEEPPHHKIP